MRFLNTLLVMFAFCVLASLPAQAQFSGTPTGGCTFGRPNGDTYVAFSCSYGCTAWDSNNGGIDHYSTSVNCNIYQVEAKFYAYGGAVMQDHTYSLGGGGTYVDPYTTLVGADPYDQGSSIHLSGSADAVPPGGYSTFGGWLTRSRRRATMPGS